MDQFAHLEEYVSNYFLSPPISKFHINLIQDYVHLFKISMTISTPQDQMPIHIQCAILMTYQSHQHQLDLLMGQHASIKITRLTLFKQFTQSVDMLAQASHTALFI